MKLYEFKFENSRDEEKETSAKDIGKKLYEANMPGSIVNTGFSFLSLAATNP
jgi:hypothetical protein